MGSFIPNNKKEVEKQKQKKRMEKQRRKEERKANGGSSLDDMIAYVDANGALTDTPPDLTVKNEVDAEDIAVSVPKKAEEDPTLTGTVEYFNEDKGFGFIKDKASVNKYFFHISNAPDNIQVGNQVTYELERGRKDMVAVNIQLITSSSVG
jgi:cold shock CspA family protein